MNFRRFFCLLALTALATNVFAHAPFDCSVRMIVHHDSVEVTITTGPTLGENFLRPASINPAQLSPGHPSTLNPTMATNFFTVTADGITLTPREADVITDGLDFQFHFEHPLAPSKTMRLESFFLPALRSTRTAPLVLTDENGNILGSTVLQPGKSTADFSLPASLFPTYTFTTANTNPPAETTVTPPSQRTSFGEFLHLGIGHILNIDAFDHLLFLVALLLGCRRLKPMLLVITGFTIAHSLTLALAALNLANISPRFIEPAIAASIIFVAAENFRRSEKTWHRYVLTCGFGLIHGFGFAGALRTSGLAGTGSEIAGPLVAFNLGVEIGQLTVAAILLPLLLLLNKWSWFARNGTRLISALVILIATFWLWQRLVS